MAREYFAVIPGNYITHLLNKFTTYSDNGEYKRMPYVKWRELKQLSKLDKVRIVCLCNSGDKIEQIIYSSVVFNADEGFFKFSLSDKGLESLNITWSRLRPNSSNMVKYEDNINSILEDIKNNNPTIISNSGDKSSITYYDNNLSSLTAQVAYATSGPSVISSQLDELQKRYNEIMETINNNKKKKENKEKPMNTNDMFNFDFGPIKDSKIRMSMYGFAIPNSTGKYVSYDIEHNRIMDVQILNFACAGMFYKIPKPLNKINVGDVVYHNGIPMFVREISEDRTRFTVIDTNEGTEKSILPAHSPFGFDYLTTLVSLMDSFDMPADEDNPFGHMLPLILLNNSNDNNSMLPLMMMMSGKMDMNNPMMLFALSGNLNMDMNNPFMAMAMMKMFDK